MPTEREINTLHELSQADFRLYLTDRARGLVRVLLEEVMQAELTALLQAQPYERNVKRRGQRNGSYSRDLTTSLGRLEEVQVPRDRAGQFQTRVFEQYQRRQDEVDHAIQTMFIKGLSTTAVGQVVGQAADGAEVIQLAKALRPDVILMDLKMPNVNGIQATRQIVSTQPRAQIVVLTTYDTDEWVFEAIRAGAVGYLLKDATTDTLAEAIRGVMRGESQIDPAIARRVLREFQHLLGASSATTLPEPSAEEVKLEQLTTREAEVLQLLAEGLSNKDIATQLVLSEGTVKNHISAILAKLHANDRTQAVLTAIKHGLVDLE